MLVVGGNSKVIGTKALRNSSWTDYRWTKWMNSFQFHSNLKAMDSWLKVLLGLKNMNVLITTLCLLQWKSTDSQHTVN